MVRLARSEAASGFQAWTYVREDVLGCSEGDPSRGGASLPQVHTIFWPFWGRGSVKMQVRWWKTRSPRALGEVLWSRSWASACGCWSHSELVPLRGKKVWSCPLRECADG